MFNFKPQNAHALIGLFLLDCTSFLPSPSYGLWERENQNPTIFMKSENCVYL